MADGSGWIVGISWPDARHPMSEASSRFMMPRKVEALKVLAFAASIAVLPTPAARSQSQTAAEAANDSIVVVGLRLRVTKIDYRRHGTKVTYCGPRDGRQEPQAVRMICQFVTDCALQGSKTRSEMSQCVDDRMAREEAGAKEQP